MTESGNSFLKLSGLLSNELGYLTEISKQSVEVQAVFFLRLIVKFESEEIN